MTRIRNYMVALMCLAPLSTAGLAAHAQTTSTKEAPRIAFIDFKRCVEQSDIGKREQKKFEQLNEKIKEAMDGKEKELTEVARLWSDPDHRDSLSPEAEEELSKRGTRLRMEYEEMRKRSMEMMQQANFQVVQTISGAVTKAAESVASSKGYSMVMNKEACFFTDHAFDITESVIAQMNQDLAAETQAETPKTAEASVKTSTTKESSNE